MHPYSSKQPTVRVDRESDLHLLLCLGIEVPEEEEGFEEGCQDISVGLNIAELRDLLEADPELSADVGSIPYSGDVVSKPSDNNVTRGVLSSRPSHASPLRSLFF